MSGVRAPHRPFPVVPPWILDIEIEYWTLNPLPLRPPPSPPRPHPDTLRGRDPRLGSGWTRFPTHFVVGTRSPPPAAKRSAGFFAATLASVLSSVASAEEEASAKGAAALSWPPAAAPPCGLRVGARAAYPHLRSGAGLSELVLAVPIQIVGLRPVLGIAGQEKPVPVEIRQALTGHAGLNEGIAVDLDPEIVANGPQAAVTDSTG